MRFTEAFLGELHDKNPVEEVIASYVPLKRSGRTLKGLCPFHNEKTPSFFVYPETSSYYCFGCGAGGDVITFIRSIENLDYLDSVKFLADRAGMTMPQTDGVTEIASTLRKRIYEANRAAARFFNETLYTEKGKEQRDYLSRRGVTKQMITRFGLGAAPDEWHALLDYLTAQGFKKHELVAANLVRVSEKNGKKNYFDAFRNKVIFPVIDIRGNVIAFGGRVLDNSKPKYINTSDTPVYKKSNELFALNFAKNGNNRKLILCEGYMDVIALHAAGFTNAVAGLGTALTAEQVSLISRYADEVALCYDNDEAGQKAVRAALALFSKTGVKVKVIKLSGGKDPDEIIKTHGSDYFKRLLEGADNDIEYKLSVARGKYITETPDGKLGFLKEAISVLSERSAIECDIYAGRLSDELEVSKEALLAQIKEEKRKRERIRQKSTLENTEKQNRLLNNAIDAQRNKNIRAAKAEDILLKTLLNNASFYAKLKGELKEELFITPLNKRLLAVLAERLENNESVEISYLSQFLTTEETAAVARLCSDRLIISNTPGECRDCIRVLEEEQKKLNQPNPAALSDEDFNNLIKQLAKNNEQ